MDTLKSLSADELERVIGGAAETFDASEEDGGGGDASIAGSNGEGDSGAVAASDTAASGASDAGTTSDDAAKTVEEFKKALKEEEEDEKYKPPLEPPKNLPTGPTSTAPQYPNYKGDPLKPRGRNQDKNPPHGSHSNGPSSGTGHSSGDSGSHSAGATDPSLGGVVIPRPGRVSHGHHNDLHGVGNPGRDSFVDYLKHHKHTP